MDTVVKSPEAKLAATKKSQAHSEGTREVTSAAKTRVEDSLAIAESNKKSAEDELSTLHTKNYDLEPKSPDSVLL